MWSAIFFLVWSFIAVTPRFRIRVVRSGYARSRFSGHRSPGTGKSPGERRNEKTRIAARNDPHRPDRRSRSGPQYIGSRLCSADHAVGRRFPTSTGASRIHGEKTQYDTNPVPSPHHVLRDDLSRNMWWKKARELDTYYRKIGKNFITRENGL